jgi:hypothetical protein
MYAPPGCDARGFQSLISDRETYAAAYLKDPINRPPGHSSCSDGGPTIAEEEEEGQEDSLDESVEVEVLLDDLAREHLPAEPEVPSSGGMTNRGGDSAPRGLVNGSGLTNGNALAAPRGMANGSGLTNGNALGDPRGMTNGIGLTNGNALTGARGMTG